MSNNHNHIHIASLEAISKLTSSLKRISEQESQNYKLLGTPSGVDLHHCVFLGLKYCPDFANQVKYYVQLETLPHNDPRNEIALIAKLHGQPQIFINFYADKEKAKDEITEQERRFFEEVDRVYF